MMDVENNNKSSSWIVVFSLLFSALTVFMLWLYGQVHSLLFISYTPDFEGVPKESFSKLNDVIYLVLGHLWCLRLAFAVLSLVLVVMAMRRKNKYSILALFASILAIVSLMIQI